jgi:hypothetical protein
MPCHVCALPELLHPAHTVAQEQPAQAPRVARRGPPRCTAIGRLPCSAVRACAQGGSVEEGRGRLRIEREWCRQAGRVCRGRHQRGGNGRRACTLLDHVLFAAPKAANGVVPVQQPGRWKSLSLLRYPFGDKRQRTKGNVVQADRGQARVTRVRVRINPCPLSIYAHVSTQPTQPNPAHAPMSQVAAALPACYASGQPQRAPLLTSPSLGQDGRHGKG